MEGLVCDACGRTLLADEDVRYVLRMEGFAAYDPLEITRQDLQRDLSGEIKSLLEVLSRRDPEVAQDEVHRAFMFDLCPRCWHRFLKDPLVGARGEEKKEKSQGD